jgi:hypothetical protein
MYSYMNSEFFLLHIISFIYIPRVMENKYFSKIVVGQSVMECVVKPLRDVKVIGSKPSNHVFVAQAGCDPGVILTA